MHASIAARHAPAVARPPRAFARSPRSRRVASFPEAALSSSSDLDDAPPVAPPVPRRALLAGAAALAALPASTSTPPPALALADAPPSPSDLAPFVGKAGFFMRYPSGWVRAMDRPGGDKGETLALVGNFKDIDTVSVRREPMTMHADFAAAADAFDAADAAAADASARAVADALTSAERAAVDANQDFGVVGGVENGKSGVMAFSLGSASARVGPGATPGSAQPYFAYEYYTETCRANIEEISGGGKQCVGPRGDVLDTIRRRNFTVATRSDGFLYTVKASALEDRWVDVGGLMREVANSFRVPQEEQR